MQSSAQWCIHWRRVGAADASAEDGSHPPGLTLNPLHICVERRPIKPHRYDFKKNNPKRLKKKKNDRPSICLSCSQHPLHAICFIMAGIFFLELTTGLDSLPCRCCFMSQLRHFHWTIFSAGRRDTAPGKRLR